MENVLYGLITVVCLRLANSAGLPFPRTHLTYDIVSYPTNEQHGRFSKSFVDTTLKRSLALWSAASPVRFRRAKRDEKADITLSFASLVHGDGIPFDGRGNDIAHTFYPDDYEWRGQIHLDDDEPWTLGQGDRGRNLFWTLAHEAGHALGLRHNTDVEDALMAPGYRGFDEPAPVLKAADVAAITALYGAVDVRDGNTEEGNERKEKEEKEKDWVSKPAKKTDCFPHLDEVFQLPNATIYGVQGSKLWRLRWHADQRAPLACSFPPGNDLKELFPGFSGRADAIFTDNFDYTWILQNLTAQRADAGSERGVRLESVFSFDTHPQFRAVPVAPVTAVLPVPSSTRSFFFSGSKYWLDARGDGGSTVAVLPIDFIALDLRTVDAGVSLRRDDGTVTMLLFSGADFYEVVESGDQLKALPGYPRPISEEWSLVPATV